MGGATRQPFGPFLHCDPTPTLLGFMCVPSVRGTGGKGKSLDYGASAWKGVFCRHLCGTEQPFALGVASFCGFIAAFTSLFAHN